MKQLNLRYMLNLWCSLLILITLLVLQGLTEGCSKKPYEPSQNNTNTTPIWPLSVGSLWNYQAISFDSTGQIIEIDTFLIRIYRDSVIGDTTWYFDQPAPFGYGYTNLADGVWERGIGQDPTFLLAKFPALVGDKWETRGGLYSAEVAGVSAQISVPAGSFVTLYYLWSPKYQNFEIQHYYFAPGVGLIRLELEEQRTNGTWYLSYRLELKNYTLVN